MILFSFLSCLAIFTLIGVLSIMRKKNTADDYLLAGRELSPALAGLSAVATTNSGFMFTGWIGMAYLMGLPSIWFMLGLGSGTLFALFKANRAIRDVSSTQGALSYGDLLSRWQGQRFVHLRKLAGLFIVIFLSTYAAAQLTAGSKALHVLLGWELERGAIIGAVIILVYCFSGGLRASVWTDVAQSLVMIVAMGILCFTALTHLGGIAALGAALRDIDPTLSQLMPQNTLFGPGLYIIGWIVTGFGILGQPHIMVRFMSLDKSENMRRSLSYYAAWYVLFFVMSFLVGLMARVLIPDISNFDPELALPKIALDLLPDALVGLILAGLFAASMSTADSLVLSCSASLTRDLGGDDKQNPLLAKLATASVTLAILMIALWGSKSVLELVMFSWSALASAFAPLIFLYLINAKLNELVACAMMVAAVATAISWKKLGLHQSIPEALPGMFAAFALYGFTLLWMRTKSMEDTEAKAQS